MTTLIADRTLFERGLVWLRRDLRLDDHAALSQALLNCRQVWCVFILDKPILDPLPRQDRRVNFIWHTLAELDAQLRQLGSGLIVRHADARQEIPALAQALKVQAVFTNHDFEPQACLRDTLVEASLKQQDQQWFSFKDQVVFEKSEVLTAQGKPYSVFTPYKNSWLKKLAAQPEALSAFKTDLMPQRLAAIPKHLDQGLPSLKALGFEAVDLVIACGQSGAQRLLTDFLTRVSQYKVARDFPGTKGPSYLSTHLRFGTVSIRTLFRHCVALKNSARDESADMEAGTAEAGTAVADTAETSTAGIDTWMSELIWREFYFQILHHHPHVTTGAFKHEYDQIVWDNSSDLFEAWCLGQTGYPLVDAAMLQLNQTGYMHNRLRMVSACFLIKDLGIDWRWGERYFAEKLLDFDLAANNGGWQWASSSGCDAQPYFRIFNPITQSEKFDKHGRFIKRYLPQLKDLSGPALHAPWTATALELQAAGIRLGENYPHPIVDHAAARLKTLARYAIVKQVSSAPENH